MIKKFFNILKKENDKNKLNNFFDYCKYGRNLITKEMKKYAGWLLSSSQTKFINGIIYYHKPKKCLEVGVADGGSSILILNSLKLIKESILVSLDLKNTI